MSTTPSFAGVKEPDYNLGTSLVAYIWTFTGISAAVLALRLFAVYHVLNRVRAADYTMVAAFIFMVATGALITKSCSWGLGRHIYYLSGEQITNIAKYIILAIVPGVLAVALGRASFCLFLISALGVDPIVRVILWITLILQALVGVTEIILQYSSCGNHIAALWDPQIHAKCIPIVSIIDYLYFLSAWSSLTDLFLTILPAYLLKNVKMQLRKKIVAMILLCISGLAFVASLTKTIMTHELGTNDVTFDWAKVNFWVTGEGYVIIIVASIPPLNSLVKWRKQTIAQNSNSTTYSNQVMVQKSWAVEHEDQSCNGKLGD